MAAVADHLSVEALEERYEACTDVTSSRHFQTIWLLAKGHSTSQVAAMTSFGQRWIEQLLERYNAEGPVAAQRGWEALRACQWSIQKPRPKNPKSATPEEADAFKKKSRRSPRKKPPNIRTNLSKSSRPTSTASA